MYTYLVVCDSSGFLMKNRKIVSGTSPIDAAKKMFPDKKVVRMYGDDACEAKFALCECFVDGDRITLRPRAHTCYFGWEG